MVHDFSFKNQHKKIALNSGHSLHRLRPRGRCPVTVHVSLVLRIEQFPKQLRRPPGLFWSFQIGMKNNAAAFPWYFYGPCCNYQLSKLPGIELQGWAGSIQVSKCVLFQTWWFWPPSFPRCNWDAHSSTICFDVISAKLQGFIKVKNDQIYRLVRTSISGLQSWMSVPTRPKCSIFFCLSMFFLSNFDLSLRASESQVWLYN